MNHRRLVLIGDENSGSAALRTLLREVGNGNVRVESLVGNDIRNATERISVILQKRNYHTTFLIVVPVTWKTPSIEWLSCVRSLNNQLALSSLNLFRNAMLVLTHSDELCQSLNSDDLTQIVREKSENEETWKYLLMSVNCRYLCVDSTQQAREYKSGILNQINRISKPSLNILVHGNNGVKSRDLMDLLHLSNHDNVIELENVRLKFYCYPDLDLYQGYQQTECADDIKRLIGSREEHGEGITLILILISQCEIFSTNMKELITTIPTNPVYRMDSRTEEYWWDYTSVLFSFKDYPNCSPDDIIRSIKGNIGIREVVKRTANRYIWMSDSSSEMELGETISTQCNKTQDRTDNREFIGGPTESYLKKIGKKTPVRSMTMNILFKVVIILSAVLLAVLLIIFLPITISVGIVLLCGLCVSVVLKKRG